MTMIERLQTNQRMSKIVRHRGVVYLCGQVGNGATVAEQTEDCLGRVDRLLREAGSSRDHILQTIVWLADMADFDEMNAVGCLGATRICPGACLRRSQAGRYRS